MGQPKKTLTLPRQTRQRRRRENRQAAKQETTARNEPVLVDQRPWYFRYGYHVGVWTGAAFGVAWYALLQDLTGLIIGIVAGQVVGVLLGRQGRSR